MKENDTSFKNKFKNSFMKYRYINALIIVMGFVFITRTQSYSELQSDSGDFVFLSPEGWYHYYHTNYIIDNWPHKLGLDILSGYPQGLESDSFGTIFEFFHATIALIIGLGNPSENIVMHILLFSSPILACIIVLIVYHFVKTLTDSKSAGLAGAILLALLPGIFLQNSTVGYFETNMLEVIFVLLILLFTMKAFNKAEKDLELPNKNNLTYNNTKPWFEIIIDPVFLLFLYTLIYPNAITFSIVLLSTIIIYSVLYNNSKKINVNKPVIISSIIVLGTIFITLYRYPELTFDTNVISSLHIFILGFILSSLILLYLINKKDLHNIKLLSYLTGFTLTTTITVYVVNSELLYTIYDILMNLLVISESDFTTEFIGFESFIVNYGLLSFVFIFGLLFYMYDIFTKYRKSQPFASDLLLVIFTIYIFVISIGNIEFNYYLAPLISIFSVIAFYKTYELIGIPDTISDVKGYHILLVLIVISVIVPILIYPTEDTVFDEDEQIELHEYNEWEDTLIWLENEAPDNNIDSNDGKSNYELILGDSEYEYNENSYGILNWSDYGYWLTAQSNQASIDNDHNIHSSEVSEYLLATDEQEANESLDEISSDTDNMRYITVDWQMISPYSKFLDIIEEHEELTQEDMYETYFTQTQIGFEPSFVQYDQRYYDSLMVQLFLNNGSQMDSSDLTLDYEVQTPTGEPTNQDTEIEQPEQEQLEPINFISMQDNPLQRFDSSEEARKHAEENDNVTHGGLGNQPPETIDALEHHRLVHSSNSNMFDNEIAQFEPSILNSLIEDELQLTDFTNHPSSVKTFERVDGAQIKGDNAPENSTVEISVGLSDPNAEFFNYVQEVKSDENGEFEATVPYSTTGYEDVDETTVDVTAISDYNVTATEGDETYSGSVEITEEQVFFEDTEAAQVSLETVDIDDEDDQLEIED